MGSYIPTKMVMDLWSRHHATTAISYKRLPSVVQVTFETIRVDKKKDDTPTRVVRYYLYSKKNREIT